MSSLHPAGIRLVSSPRLLLTLLLCLLAAHLAHAAPSGVRIAPVPPELRTDKFAVTINGHQAYFAHAASGYYFLNYDTALDTNTGTHITITAADPAYWQRGVEISPWRLNIRPAVHGRTITFTLHGAAKLSITRPGDHSAASEMLFLFANPPETFIPDLHAPGVTYYRAGVYHGSLNPRSGDTLYLAPGAIVYGSLNLWQVENVRVIGRGVVIYDGPQNPATDEGWMHKPDWHAIVMDNAHNIEVSGLTFVVRSRTWMIQMRDSHQVGLNNIKVIGGSPGNANQDGMDWLGGGDTTVRDVFIRAADDTFAIQGNWNGYSEEALRTPGHDVRNITIEDSTVSTSISNIVRMGWPRKVFNSSNFLMRNVDVLHAGLGACGIPFALFEVWADPDGHGLHTGYRFDDIRLESWYSLLQVQQPNPALRDISMTDIWAMETPSMAASSLLGDVQQVHLSDISIGGRYVTEDAAIPLTNSAGAAPPTYGTTDAPAAAFTYTPGMLAPHQPVTFEAGAQAVSAGTLRYDWFFGDSATATGTHVTHRFADTLGTLNDHSGRFRVLLRVTDAQGRARWTQRPVVIAAALSPAAQPSAALAPALAAEPGTAAATYTGYLRVPTDGGYTLTMLAATDTSLSIDGKLIASTPAMIPQVCGSPGNATQPARGSIALAAGLHAIRITAASPDPWTLDWEGPGILLTGVPVDALLHPAPSSRPPPWPFAKACHPDHNGSLPRPGPRACADRSHHHHARPNQPRHREPEAHRRPDDGKSLI